MIHSKASIPKKWKNVKMKYRRSYKCIIRILTIANILILVSLFHGRNTPQNYFKYRKELRQKQQVYNNILRERYRIKHTMQILSNSSQNNDLLDEYLRQFLQFSDPNENIILLEND